MATVAPHLRPRGDGAPQPITAVELFFDLVFVLAVTQLSHLVLSDLTVTGLLRAGFLLLVVWWAWINTTWLANRLEPASRHVRIVLLGGALAALLLAAALPEALGSRGVLFAASYVALQTGRNVFATLLSPRGHRLRLTFARLLFWSTLAGAVWMAGAFVSPDHRLLVWGAALAPCTMAPAPSGSSGTLDGGCLPTLQRFVTNLRKERGHPPRPLAVRAMVDRP